MRANAPPSVADGGAWHIPTAVVNDPIAPLIRKKREDIPARLASLAPDASGCLHYSTGCAYWAGLALGTCEALTILALLPSRQSLYLSLYPSRIQVRVQAGSQAFAQCVRLFWSSFWTYSGHNLDSCTSCPEKLTAALCCWTTNCDIVFRQNVTSDYDRFVVCIYDKGQCGIALRRHGAALALLQGGQPASIVQGRFALCCVLRAR